MTRLRVGISTCPNDTYLFHGILTGAVRDADLELDVELLDVEELNRGLIAGRFDVAKASFAATLPHADRFGVLPTGAALGFGVGPVLLARPGFSGLLDDRELKVLAPGEHTTATLLWRLFHADGAEPRQVVFSEIMPALERAEADLGICIHEGRFTWPQSQLDLVEDLGATWERATETALPLGGLHVRLELGADVHRRVQHLVRRSLEAARVAPRATLPTMRRHAREDDEAALFAHVDLYVDENTHELGEVGETALRRLRDRAVAAGLLAADRPALTVVGR